LLRVLHLTDPHLFAAKDGSLRGTVTFTSLTEVLAHYQDGDWQADIAVVTGDLIQDDSAAAYELFSQLLGGLDLPVYCVPGNHDVRDLMQDALREPPFFYCGSVELNDWLIVGIDSCVSDRAGGLITDAEFDRVDAAIAASAAANVMLYLHHPPVALGSKWLDSVGMENGDTALRRFSNSGKVRLAVFGHVHQNFSTEYSGMQIIATPSTCSQFASGSAEFAIDDNPPAYRRIELHADGSHDNELIWVGGKA
jgi:Icc protein